MLLELEASDPEDFVGNCRDGQIADTQSLEFEFCGWLVVKVHLFEGIHF